VLPLLSTVRVFAWVLLLTLYPLFTLVLCSKFIPRTFPKRLELGPVLFGVLSVSVVSPDSLSTLFNIIV
jgi:hypothetical protein